MKTMRISIARLMGLVLVVALGFGGLKGANEYWASGCFTLMIASLILAILNAAQGRGKDRAFWAGFAVAGGIYFAIAFGTGESSRAAYPPLLSQMAFNRLEPLIHPELNPGGANGSITVATSPSWISYTATAAPLAVPPGATPPAGSTSVDLIVDQSVVDSPTPAAPVASPPVMPTAASPAPASTIGWSSLASLSPFQYFASSPVEMTRVHYSQVAQSLTALLAGMLGGLYSLWFFARRERREVGPTAEVSPSSP